MTNAQMLYVTGKIKMTKSEENVIIFSLSFAKDNKAKLVDPASEKEKRNDLATFKFWYKKILPIKLCILYSTGGKRYKKKILPSFVYFCIRCLNSP